MAGNPRFELSSASPDSSFHGNYAQRGTYSGPGLGRSGSFREGSDVHTLNSGKGTPRGSGPSTGDVSTLSQCLMLEPIVMLDQKYPRSGELRRVLGFSGGSMSEDNSFGATHLRNSPPVAVEELKRFRASVADTCIRASGRAKKLDEHLHKLGKYFEATTSKKQQRNELLTNERPGSACLKIGNQMNRSPSDIALQKLEDRSKNGTLNKRVRTSVAENRAEGRSNGLPRQPLMMPKDMVRDHNMDSHIVEEKIRRLPAGGESWDKKMKRKRSVGAVSARPNESDGEPKRTVHHKLTNESGLQPSDSQSFRSGAPNVTGSISKLDGTLSPANSNTRATIKVEQDKSTLSREHLAKGSAKLSNREDNHGIYPSPVAKGKASRAPRSGSSTATNSISNTSRVSGTLESWELSQSTNKNSTNGANNRKRALPSGSSSPPITQWVGQRPQKSSRTRRANLISPVSNHDELQTPSEGCSPSDFGSRLTSSGTNISLIPKGPASSAQNLKAKPENVSSPARFSESEESGAGENRVKEKAVASSELEEKAVNAAQSVGTSPLLLKKNKLLVKEEIGDGIRRQGRSGRGSSVSRASISPVSEKLDSAPATKPIRSVKPASDKSGSKSGRPLKKASDRKGFSRLGHAISAGSPDFTGESDDDREELLSSANLAYNSSVLACSSAFWRKVEGLFASISSEGKSYLAEQLKLSKELHERLAETLGNGGAIQGNCSQDEISLSDALSGERSRSTQNKSESRDLCNTDDSVDQVHNSTVCGGLDAGRRFDHVTPLYQRVLSALIIEDDVEEFDDNGWERCMPHQNPVVASPDDACFVDAESKHRNGEFECESVYGVHTQSNGHANRLFSHHTSSNYTRKSRVLDSPCDSELSQRENGYVHSEVQVFVGLSGGDLDGEQSHRSSSIECQYEQMCLEDKLLLELHSIGLYPETVPDLHDKEDEVINQEIIQLNRGLYQQVIKKKSRLEKIYEAIQGGQDVEGSDLELVAMNKLVEIAYKKLLATRGSLASKNGMPRVSRQVALAFARRTLARCKKFEDCGVSCFNEPGLRDIIFAPAPQISEVEPLTGGRIADTSRNKAGGDTFDNYSHQSEQAFAKNGPILNRGKKKEVLLDDVGGAAIRTTSLGSSLLGGAKGKRSERDASVRNSITKAGRSSLGNSKGERKTKTKPKQKTAQLSTSGNGFMNPVYPSSTGGSGELMNNSGNRKREVGLISPGNGPPDSVKEKKESLEFANMPLNDIDLPMEELGVGPDIGGNQDFNSWFNFEDDGLQDHDAVGLDIPMDDLSELMF
ncbi:uncharacterized protein [Coffea arabica]|uniref:Uncharacterized protein LOC113725658 isoform X1 n=1 Tax=Coffea arabica TaxID=13443 RepID=A0A6P6VP12_COFAR|nr:uncharacterized protein LOC113725658 isoform X1 [Coffea arabica]XP_027104750.1 uncharacterized protein LOC113725658 isoform X1 [Coffea arabica]